MDRKREHQGIFFIILSALCFAVMNMFVHMAGDLPSMQKSFFRNLVAAVFAWLILIREGEGFHFQKSSLSSFLMRSVFGTLGIVCNFYAVDHLVLADASMLNKMSPFFSVLFSWFLLKEKVTVPQFTIILGAFFGSMFVVKPTFANLELLPSLVGLIGGISAGAAYTYVRKLGQLGENGSFIVFFFSAFSSVVILPWFLAHYQPMAWGQVLLLILGGLAAAGGQFAITAAYCCAPASRISVYDYSQIIFSTILGFFAFGQIPDALSFVGYGIICAMAAAMFLYNNRRQCIQTAGEQKK